MAMRELSAEAAREHADELSPSMRSEAPPST